MPETIKVGDKVRRTKPHLSLPEKYPTGYEFIVKLVGGKACQEAHSPVYHSSAYLEKVIDLETELKEAQARVEALKAQIKQQNQPKVGDRYLGRMSGAVYSLVYEDKHHFAYVRQDGNGRGWLRVSELNNGGGFEKLP